MPFFKKIIILNDFNFEEDYMIQPNKLHQLEIILKKKEIQAQDAKEKGMYSTFSNLMTEIIELKREVRKLSMGSR